MGVGTAESAVPSGLGDFATGTPKAEALGYCRLALRDRGGLKMT